MLRNKNWTKKKKKTVTNSPIGIAETENRSGKDEEEKIRENLMRGSNNNDVIIVLRVIIIHITLTRCYLRWRRRRIATTHTEAYVVFPIIITAVE